MKVLFVSSGNSGEIGTLVKNQGESLRNVGIDVEYFLIKGRGFWGYFTSILKIRRAYYRGNYSIAHAHYSLSAFATSLAGRFPLVVSLMGSDAYLYRSLRLAAKFFYRIRWNAAIVKTQRMKNLLGMNQTLVIPNGVDLKKFKPISKVVAREYIGYPENKKIILFIANPERYEKNYSLAMESVKTLNNDDIELLPVFNKPDKDITYYMNAADVLLLTSKWEGSVNIIKEAMACNCPIVSTDVGDVRWIIGETEGCYITSFDPHDVAEKIKLALHFAETKKKTNGRQRIIDLGLDSETVAGKIIEVYEKVLNC